MLRLPGKLLGVLAALALAAHGVLAVRGFHARWYHPDELLQNLVWLLAALAVAALGRLVLSLFPPGDPGGHAPGELPETAAASLALGWASACALAVPCAFLAARRGDAGASPWPAYALAALVVVLVALVRWLTLPGAMVPRHAVAQESFGRARPLLAGAALAWLVHAALTRAFVAALAWLALGILLERALRRARRAAAGRALFLCAFAVLGHPGASGRGELDGLATVLGVAAALGAGAASLVPWLRRADRRAGLLAAVFLSAPLLVAARDPLAWVGPLVVVGAARPRQRPFALRAVGACALLFAGFGWLYSPPGRGRLLRADELARVALDVGAWGLAWPLALVALALGAATFPWSAPPWSGPGAIETPRREVVALTVLVALVTASLALPGSPWFEGQALVILFPPLALLTGLVAIGEEVS